MAERSLISSHRSKQNEHRSGVLHRAFQAEELLGLKLAAQARVVAVAVIMAWLLLTSQPPVLYYYLICVGLFLGAGVAHYLLRLRFGLAWLSYIFVAFDCLLMMYTILLIPIQVVPEWPAQMVLRFSPFSYFFLILAAVAVNYSPRLMVWAGVCGAGCWGSFLIWITTQPQTVLIDPIDMDANDALGLFLDRHFVNIGGQAEKALVFVLVAGVLAVVVRRSRQLVEQQASAARERANLARYFSPSVVDELAERDEPLGPIRRQDVAVMFVDIVGFTHMAEAMQPEQVMTLLRDFHSRMEAEVFAHNGTLEKFIGDALLATFGVPYRGKQDATDALSCAYAMLDSLNRWNGERTRRAEPVIQIGIGIHYGPAVMGDIGSERNMAFAVIGDTVNTTSRLQALTRDLDCQAVLSDALIRTIQEEQGNQVNSLLADLHKGGPQAIRGREEQVSVWVLPARELSVFMS